jgi:hypothetical protein
MYNPLVAHIASCVVLYDFFLYIWCTTMARMVYEAYPTTLVDSPEEQAHAHVQENLTVPTPQ